MSMVMRNTKIPQKGHAMNRNTKDALKVSRKAVDAGISNADLTGVKENPDGTVSIPLSTVKHWPATAKARFLNMLPEGQRAAARKKIGMDAVSPSVRGLKTIIPSTVGIAENARYKFEAIARDASMVAQAATIAQGARATGDAQLCALADQLAPLLKKAADKLQRQLDSVLRMQANSGEVPDKIRDTNGELVANPESDYGHGAANAPAGARSLDGFRRAARDTGMTLPQVMTADALAAREEANARAAKIKMFRDVGDEANARRVAWGQQPVADVDETPYDAVHAAGKIRD